MATNLQGSGGFSGLAVPLPGLLFSKNEYGKLTDALFDCERSTEVCSIGDESQLALSRKGVTAGGEKMSWLAVRQVCKILSAGLSASLSDLLGMKRPEATLASSRNIADPDEDFNVSEAAALYNLVLKKRFGRLFGCRYLKNTDTKVIESVVGGRYTRISNSDFLSIISSVLESCEPKYSFHSASVSGRKLCLTYSKAKSLPCGLTLGIKIINSEIGDSSIKASIALIDGNGNTMTSSYDKLSRVSHSGRDLSNKVSKLIGDVLEKSEASAYSEEALSLRISEAGSKLLGFTGDNEDSAKFYRLIDFLNTKNGLTYSMAKRCISATLTGSSADTHNFNMLDRSKLWPLKSAMSLVFSIMNESRINFADNFYLRDRFEKVAWGIFFNKLKIPNSDS